MKSTSNYAARGVSSDKKAVHEAIKKLDKGLFPGAFCKIFQDPKDQNGCRGLHADTAGTIPALAALAYKLTGDLQLTTNVAVNSLVMNLDDVGCIGALSEPMMVNQTIAINPLYFGKNGEVDILVARLMQRVEKFTKMLGRYGIKVEYVGGETANVGNTTRTFDVGNSLYFSIPKNEVIDAGKIVPGDFIVGFSSAGKAEWEDQENSGIGSNGLTSAIHDLLCSKYRKHKETYAPQVPKNLVYRGKFFLGDILDLAEEFSDSMTIGEALLSPTRTYLPLIKKLLKEIPRKKIHGFIHCSGGGLTKLVKFGAHGNRYVINNPLPIPPIFEAIQNAGTSWEEMYKVFNMGQRLVMATPDNWAATKSVIISKQLGINAEIIGKVERKLGPGPNKMQIESPHGKFHYQA